MRRGRIKVLITVFFVLLLYCGSYGWLRYRHYFIHRAGRYADPPTNHYIAAGEAADGPQVFGSAMLQFAAAGKEPTAQELEAALSDASERGAAEEHRRKRLLIFFKPLTFMEELIWKIVNPNPKV